MPDFSPFIVMSILLSIALFFGYLFLFRLPSAQIDPRQQEILDALNQDDPDTERITIVLYSKIPARDQLRSVLVVVPEFEPINLRRQTPQHNFQYFSNQIPAHTMGYQQWDTADYETLRAEITTTLHQRIDEYVGQGWQIVLQIPFSDVDHMVYLQRPYAQSV